MWVVLKKEGLFGNAETGRRRCWLRGGYRAYRRPSEDDRFVAYKAKFRLFPCR